MSPASPHDRTSSSGKDERKIFSVKALVRRVRTRLETEFRDVWVEGEIADLARPRSGHLYFSLHDEGGDAALRAVMWASDARRLRFDPDDGTLIRARGTLTIYEVRGAFQMRVVEMEVVGEGDLRRQFEKVKARLEKQGLLQPERKRPLPALPRRIGVVTSRDGAALRDIVKVLADRFQVSVVLCHTTVQGSTAPGEIVSALSCIAAVDDVEVVIVGRGGGSGDDLWAWNDEVVALAIAKHPVPVITAIGHETDVTIADLVADRRAATPSEAAMLAVPDVLTVQRSVTNFTLRLANASRFALQRRRTRLEGFERRLPGKAQLLDDRLQRLDELSGSVEAHIRPLIMSARSRHHAREVRLASLHPKAQLEQDRARLSKAAAALHALSPLDVLGRGYSLTKRPDGQAVTKADEVSRGDRLEVTLHEGEVDCEVLSTRPGAQRPSR